MRHLNLFRHSFILVALLGVLGIGASAAQAETTGPVWKVIAVSHPTNFEPGDKSGKDEIWVTVTNVGGASSGCTAEQIAAEPLPVWSPIRPCPAGSPVVSPITISDSLPPGLTLAPEKENEIHQKIPSVKGVSAYHDPWAAPGEAPPYGLSCSTSSPTTPSCTTSEPVDPGDTLLVDIEVHVNTEEEGSSEVNRVSISGGGATPVSASDPISISSEPSPYGIAAGGLFAAASTSQAGAHPNVTTGFSLNTIREDGDAGAMRPAGEPKDVSFDLPPGLVGTTVGVPRCTMADVTNDDDCPRDAMVGMTTVMLTDLQGKTDIITTPVFNIAPAPGEPAAFAFNAWIFAVRLDTSVLSDGDYGVRVSVPDITAGGADFAAFTTIWGVPADHNGPGPDASSRTYAGGFYLSDGGTPQITFGGPGVEKSESGGSTETILSRSRVPLLTNPSQCSEPLTAELLTDSWEAPGAFATEGASLGADSGCGQLSFKPSVSMLPDTLEAGAPAGYAFDLSLPQNTEPEGLATPDVRKTTVTLPAGTVISPSAADGLGDCTHEQFYGSGPPEQRSATPGDCPRDSQVGEVEVKTPALEERLKGDVYLGAPECTGPGGVCTPADAADGKMIHLYVQFVSIGEGGIVVKLQGTGQINQQTDQVTTTFNETPELPFSEFQLTLQGGERATLANPRTCGEVTTTADLTPWSTPYTPDATPTSSFDVDENCFGQQFNPSFSFGTTSNQAGGYSPFSVSFGRGDHDGFLNGIQVRTPPGLLGMLSHVKLCEEPQANAGTCSPESQIGETSVETGPGADPFLVTGGKVFITGPYKGAPYGLSIVVPAKAGPYTLAGTTGNGTVVNRSTIAVNPETSALTVTSDPLPTELDGIPLQLRLVNVTIDRPEFMFNATSCDKMAIGGTLTDTQAASAVEASSYQVTNCAALKFQPKFTVATSGKTSKAKGASLDAKVSFPNTGQGTQADIHSFKVDLPKQLPSRLTTLQKACLASVFEADPANCPAPSVIGTVRVHTPVLPVELTGPVYFVSHGGEAFPSLEIVLQGDGVRVDVVAATFISKTGITSSTFKTVPDVPFESFELYLPEGPYSALAANGNLCTSKLAMPTAIVAQNGAKINESTPIAVTGCPKAKKAVKKKHKKKKKAKKASRARKSSHGQGGRS